MVKLIASDVDGTLVKDSSPYIYPEMPQAIKELKKKGIIFCVASGRQYYSIRSLFKEVADDIAYIAENGAHIVYKGETLDITPMDREYAEGIVKLYRKYHDTCECIVSTPKATLMETDNREFIELIRNNYRNRYELVHDVLDTKEPIIKISIYNKKGIRELGENEFIPLWQDKVKATMAGEEWVDFMSKEVDKGNGLRFLEQHFGISREETWAFGDNDNDLGMLKEAGLSFAVETARDRVKQQADRICPSYNDKGVYQIIKTLI